MNARRSPTWVAAVLLLAAGAAHAQNQATWQAGDAFLKLLDGQSYAESWDQASEFLKRSVSRGEWIAQMKQTREPLGSAAVRTLTNSEMQHDPAGAPKGDYLLLTYETTLSGAMIARTETLPMVLGADGRWRAVGYFVR